MVTMPAINLSSSRPLTRKRQPSLLCCSLLPSVLSVNSVQLKAIFDAQRRKAAPPGRGLEYVDRHGTKHPAVPFTFVAADGVEMPLEVREWRGGRVGPESPAACCLQSARGPAASHQPAARNAAPRSLRLPIQLSQEGASVFITMNPGGALWTGGRCWLSDGAADEPVMPLLICG